MLQTQEGEGAETPISQSYNYRASYSDDYVCPSGLKIVKFERTGKDGAYTGSALEYTFVNAYPFTISSMPISYDSSSLLKCTVSFSYLRYVINELNDSNVFGTRQTPALNKQLVESFADQSAFNFFTDAPDFGLGIAVSAGLDGIMRNNATGEPV